MAEIDYSEQLSQIIVKCDDIATKLSQIQTKQNSLENKLTTMQNNLSSIENKQDSTLARMSNLQVVNLKENFDYITKKIKELDYRTFSR
ncbi:hypothetical protein [Campylobacter hyointestinalis]|uniref:Uncharacterized protein n=1 Tax=Campylobacter hyointestinalis subsp. hyointestinalis TaxID=91352 RepID=A0A9W5AND5_CAMHY|nr:hypothetical protein [Campylobacter hyointestinalis]CUU74356.1 Uncharacterised protein [Campylobacter hyointestinalis subsp. hyointestinalis]CUU82147.1 Uncharacterised protein [Campylobacter hyointestinalis subsp. hyointestinalis]